jgi:hypothetical protein
MIRPVTISPGEGLWTEEEMYELKVYIEGVRNLTFRNSAPGVALDEESDTIHTGTKSMIWKLKKKGSLDFTLLIFAHNKAYTPTWEILPSPSRLSVWTNVERCRKD